MGSKNSQTWLSHWTTAGPWKYFATWHHRLPLSPDKLENGFSLFSVPFFFFLWDQHWLSLDAISLIFANWRVENVCRIFEWFPALMIWDLPVNHESEPEAQETSGFQEIETINLTFSPISWRHQAEVLSGEQTRLTSLKNHTGRRTGRRKENKHSLNTTSMPKDIQGCICIIP